MRALAYVESADTPQSCTRRSQSYRGAACACRVSWHFINLYTKWQRWELRLGLMGAPAAEGVST